MNHGDIFNQAQGRPGSDNSCLEALIVGSGRTSVKLELWFQGRDLLLLITGGKVHVGAVAVWDGAAPEGRAVVVEMSGHREGPLAGECAEALGRASGRTIAAVAGIHQDNATREEIAAIVENVRRGTAALAKQVAPNQRASDD
jgi:hypothetical protein